MQARPPVLVPGVERVPLEGFAPFLAFGDSAIASRMIQCGVQRRALVQMADAPPFSSSSSLMDVAVIHGLGSKRNT